jgi:hypothetical protein
MLILQAVQNGSSFCVFMEKWCCRLNIDSRADGIRPYKDGIGSASLTSPKTRKIAADFRKGARFFVGADIIRPR